jgi:hypothetical protein
MKQYKMETSVSPYFVNNEISIPELSCYPWELEDSWIHVCKTNNKKSPYIVSFYNNKDYERGTIIYSEFIYHKYPTSYVIFNEKNLAERIYTNPVYRGRGYWKWVPLVLRCFFYNNLNKIYLDATPERSMAGERAYKKAIHLLKQKHIYINNGRMNIGEIDPPRDPAFPYVWYNQRIKGIKQ